MLFILATGIENTGFSKRKGKKGHKLRFTLDLFVPENFSIQETKYSNKLNAVLLIFLSWSHVFPESPYFSVLPSATNMENFFLPSVFLLFFFFFLFFFYFFFSSCRYVTKQNHHLRVPNEDRIKMRIRSRNIIRCFPSKLRPVSGDIKTKL